ncbi:MarR family winged helix-turn-helix transcriptional regulator [Agromyces aurantiacus]|uniref:HTH-type transcriptional regulator SarZ n=1 Tax=Agromyces aurantiacus TaxID=165814 RepID=A0ABV9R9Q3_9MICO|nr:MarR family transcriptional regulator [Agromyces aurantiacus]MBM7503567.1 DNA-binding MarR family transcriptional regulator [Agromyces aurantiacus]
MAVTDEMVCFSLYAASRATTQLYRTLLERWGLTYPQYLVLVALWREGEQTVTSLGDLLQLDSGTLSPLLRRMEQSGLVTRARSAQDERVVTLALGERGTALRGELAHLPSRIAEAAGVRDADAESLIRTLQEITSSMHAAAASAHEPRSGSAARASASPGAR